MYNLIGNILQLTETKYCANNSRYLPFVTGPANIDHVSAKNRRFLVCLLYHNFISIYTTATKSSSLLQNLMGFLLQLTETG